jgi:AcrR family transcriptional regulator
MNRPVRTGKDFDEARARILEAAEKQFRRVGYHRTSVADIAAELGMSPANIYRFFPSDEFSVEDAAEAARAVKFALMPFLHPILIEHCAQDGEDTEASLRDQIRFILKALGRPD